MNYETETSYRCMASIFIQNENFSTIYNKFNSDLFTMLHDVSIF